MDNVLTSTEIAGYAEGLRRLALALVRDAADADDAVQETLVQALRSPPRRGPTTGAWFKTVLRNTVRRGWRGAARRSAREQAASPPGNPEAPPARMERTEMAQAVVAALASLPPEQREVLELRFFEAQKPAAIAAQLGLPVETVKTRIKRGKQSMRDALDREHPRTWVQGCVASFGFSPEALGLAAKAGLAVPAVIVALLLALLGAWWFAGMDGGSEASTAQEHASLIGEDAPAPVPEGLVLVSAGAEARPGSAAPSKADDEAPEAKALPDGVVEVPGRLEVVDAAGRRVRVPEGALKLTLWNRGGVEREVPVRGGRFTLTLKGEQRPEFDALAFGDQVARILEPRGTVKGALPETYVVKARVVAPTLVHVIDAETAQPLDQVCWQRVLGRNDHVDHPGPGAHEGLVWSGNPVRIPPILRDLRGAEVRCLIGAPGYGWEGLEYRATDEAEVRIELRRGGRVRVRTPGPALTLKVKPEVRIRATDRPGVGYRAFWALAPNGEYVLQDIPVGAYEARIEVGDWFGTPQVLAKRAFTVAAGETVDLSLPYDDVEPPEPVHARGTLHLPAGYPRDRLFVSLRRLGSTVAPDALTRRTVRPGKGLTADAEDAAVFGLDLGRLQTGRYQVDIMAIGYMGELEITEENAASLRLAVPAPVQVTLAVEGDTGGLAPFIEKIHWAHVPPQGSRMHSWKTEERSAPGEPFRFTVPAGVINVRPEGYAYRATRGRFELRGERTSEVLQVHPNGELIVRVRDKDARLRWDWAWPIEVEAVGHAGKGGSRGVVEDGHGYHVYVDRPGRYRVRVGPIPGYEPLPAREIEVGTAKAAEIVYDLETRR